MTEFVPGGGDDELTIPPDTYAESDEFTTWPVGYSIMVVTSGANWGPNSGEAGIVTTKSANTEGIQTFEAYNGSTYKRAYTDDAWSEWAEVGGGGDVDHIVSLAEDEFAESAAITAYPDGVSIMPVSDTANWDENETPGSVTTHNISGDRWQHLHVRFIGAPDTSSVANRTWDESSSTWGDWVYFVMTPEWTVQNDFLGAAIVAVADDLAAIDTTYLESLGEGSFAESDTPDNYYNGLSIHQVAAAEDWGGFGQRAFVETIGDLTNATQTMHAFNGNTYKRRYTSGAWSSWAAL